MESMTYLYLCTKALVGRKPYGSNCAQSGIQFRTSCKILVMCTTNFPFWPIVANGSC